MQAPIAGLGLWLMTSPFVLGYSHAALIWSDVVSGAVVLVMSLLAKEAAADSNHLVGSLVIVVSVIALAEVARPARFLNAPLGLWLVLAPWFLDGSTEALPAGRSLGGLPLDPRLPRPLERAPGKAGLMPWIRGSRAGSHESC